MSVVPSPVYAAVSDYEVRFLVSGQAWDEGVSLSPSTFIAKTTSSLSSAVVIRIPPSSIGGYIITYGIYPGYTFQKPSTNPGSVSYSSINFLPPSYFLGYSMPFVFPFFSDGATGDINYPSTAPYTGMVYIPPHTESIFLTLYCSLQTSVTAVPQYNAVSVASSAKIQFVPDDQNVNNNLTQILEQITNIKNEITSSPEQDQYSQQLVDQIDSLLSQISELNEQIQDVTIRPPPDSILPTPPQDLLPPVDPVGQSGYQFVSSFLESPLILTFLLMVFTLALIRYVLFGKSGS